MSAGRGRRRPTWSSSAPGSPGYRPRWRRRDAGLRVVVVTKDAPDAGSTRWAQGGIAVVLGDIDRATRVDAHVADTLAAGGGLVDAGRRARRSSPTVPPRWRAAGAGARSSTRRRPARASPAPARAGTPRSASCTPAATRPAPRSSGPCSRRRRRAARRARRAHRGRRCAQVPTGTCSGLAVAATTRARPASLARARRPAGHRRRRRALRDDDQPRRRHRATAGRSPCAPGAALADVEFVQFHPTALYTGPALRGRAPAGHRGAARGGRRACVDRAGRPRDGRRRTRCGDLAPRDVVAGAITAGSRAPARRTSASTRPGSTTSGAASRR